MEKRLQVYRTATNDQGNKINLVEAENHWIILYRGERFSIHTFYDNGKRKTLRPNIYKKKHKAQLEVDRLNRLFKTNGFRLYKVGGVNKS